MVRDITRLAAVAATFASALVLTAPVPGCTNVAFTAATDDPSTGDLPNTGSIGLELDVGSGVTLNSVGYEISGNGYSKRGDVDISQSPVLTAVIGGLPVGDGFTIVITATTPDGSVTCVGTATFSVMDGAITKVTIHLQCHRNPRIGRIDLTGDVDLCPSIDELTVTPIDTAVGGTITLRTQIADSDGPARAIDTTFGDGSTTLSLHGHLSSIIALTCTKPGPSRIALTVSDGECLQASTIDVTCSGVGNGSPATWSWQQLTDAP